MEEFINELTESSLYPSKLTPSIAAPFFTPTTPHPLHISLMQL